MIDSPSQKNPEPRLFAVVPCAPEDQDKYFPAVMEHLNSFVDDLLVIHDPEREMMQHEGRFRSLMLHAAVEVFMPRDGIDWILVNDADEFIVASTEVYGVEPGSPRPALQRMMEWDADSLLFARDELWNINPPMRRVDKLWGDITNYRMFRYRSDRPIEVRPSALACGSIPEWAEGRSIDCTKSIRVLHAGYAHPDDRAAKFLRYGGRPGHNPDHIDSIMDIAVMLEPLQGTPNIYRGTHG